MKMKTLAMVLTAYLHLQQMRQKKRLPKQQKQQEKRLILRSQRGWEMTSTVSAWSLTVR